uniref:Bestrophin homolog n=1 Tax=Panagrellus redivivus TaxID=6233 RepID=A0A7E4V6V5_PANRE
MLEFLSLWNEQIPIRNLSHGFKQRLITLAPLSVVNNFSKVYPYTKKYRSLLPEAYDHVFITDSDDVFNKASENRLLLKIVKFLHRSKWLRYLSEGPYIINPIWNAVLLFDEIIDRNLSVCADQTLILYIQSIENYENVIPRIYGRYNRLVLHGNLTWDQAKRLIHPNVIEIRIVGRIQMSPLQHNDFVQFVKQYCRSKEHRWKFVLIYVIFFLIHILLHVFTRYVIVPRFEIDMKSEGVKIVELLWLSATAAQFSFLEGWDRVLISMDTMSGIEHKNNA